ncbi:MAG: DUF421 domain-containing protein [Corynebacterium sp.]|uniref:DUF421 domain-containing protein n=1 Tax=Corynebacterium sp. TaxID=1720 RepID=UPI0026DEF274|nr:YetF domain-containing protein [Corynebacterium sp.]MDO5670301.1 DUF421 domain-containing protein [Corynebacterium sp.]
MDNVDRYLDELLIEPWRIPVIIITAVGIYLGFMILAKTFGSRVLLAMTASDAVIVIMFGAVAGRVIIGHPPTLAAGLVGLATLMSLEAAFGTLRRYTGWGRALSRRPVLVVLDGQLLIDAMHQAHLSRTDVLTAVRRAGLGSGSQVKAMVLEPVGTMSVIREGQPFDPAILRGVKGY